MRYEYIKKHIWNMHKDGSNRTKYGKWFGIDGVPWCGIFCSWVYKYIFAIILFSSCSANYHLNKAKRHIKIAYQKGTKTTTDTVYKEIKVPYTKIDTFIDKVTVEKILRDTILVQQKNEVIKIKYVPKEKRIYVISQQKKPVYIKVPVAVNNKIEPTASTVDIVIMVAFLAIAVLAITNLKH